MTSDKTNLQGIPKIFFIDICRGKKQAETNIVQCNPTYETRGKTYVPEPSEHELNPEADVALAYKLSHTH